jgi:hypothetical protein
VERTGTSSSAKGDTGAAGSTPQLRINPSTNQWEICTGGTGANDSDWESTGMTGIEATGKKGGMQVRCVKN